MDFHSYRIICVKSAIRYQYVMLVGIRDFHENCAGKEVSFWRKYNCMVTGTVKVSLQLKNPLAQSAYYVMQCTICTIVGATDHLILLLVLEIT